MIYLKRLTVQGIKRAEERVVWTWDYPTAPPPGGLSETSSYYIAHISEHSYAFFELLEIQGVENAGSSRVNLKMPR